MSQADKSVADQVKEVVRIFLKGLLSL